LVSRVLIPRGACVPLTSARVFFVGIGLCAAVGEIVFAFREPGDATHATGGTK